MPTSSTTVDARRRTRAKRQRKAATRSRLSRKFAVSLASGALLVLGGCNRTQAGFMTPGGPVAKFQFHHFWQVTFIVLIVVMPVLIGVPLLAWRYRYGNTKARYAPHWEFSKLLEYPMWLVPAAIVVVLSVFVWRDTHKLDPYRPLANRQSLKVEVVGLDWKWLFIYPKYHIATVGEMAFPLGQDVSIKLTTDTVMQSFLIAALGGQIYAMPGMVTELHLATDQVGHFDGENTQYSGLGFHDQHFNAVSMTKADFNNWVKSVQNEGVALSRMDYAKLAQRTTPKQVHAEFGNPGMPPHATYFNNVAPGFFAGIVKRYRSAKGVPSDQQPGALAYDATKLSE